MALTREQCGEYLQNAQVRAFLRCIREGESGQTEDAYRIINGGTYFDAPPWRHPWPDGTPTTQGGRASGAYQFLPSTWKRVAAALGGVDFSPPNQDAGAVYLIDGRGALDAVMAGDLVKACSLLRDEWVALPQMGLQRLQRVFLAYGGTLTPGAEVSQAPPPAPKPPPQPATQPPQPEATAMPLPILALISAFGPVIAQLIPQVASIFQPKTEVSQRNVKLAQVVFDTITAATQSPNIQTAIEKMQSDPEALKVATQAVVTEPTIMEALTISPEGIKDARAAQQKFVETVAVLPWWQVILTSIFNPVLLVSAGLLPLIYKILWDLAPFFDKLGADAISGVINTVIGLVLGGVCGFWLGQTYQQVRQQQAARSAREGEVATQAQ